MVLTPEVNADIACAPDDVLSSLSSPKTVVFEMWVTVRCVGATGEKAVADDRAAKRTIFFNMIWGRYNVVIPQDRAMYRYYFMAMSLPSGVIAAVLQWLR